MRPRSQAATLRSVEHVTRPLWSSTETNSSAISSVAPPLAENAGRPRQPRRGQRRRTDVSPSILSV